MSTAIQQTEKPIQNRPYQPATDFDGPAVLGFANQHPVIKMPFTASIDGRSYEGEGISLVAAYVKGLVPANLLGAVHLATLQFSFDGFVILIPIRVRVTSAAGQMGRIELAFTDPAGPHLPQLRCILNAFVAGDLIRIGDAILVSGSHRDAPAPQGLTNRIGVAGMAHRLLGIVATVAMTAGLAALVAAVVYGRFYSVELPGPAFVVAEGSMLRAVSAGQLDFINPNARRGDVAFAIKTTTGNTVSIEMPCDCVVTPKMTERGATLLAGDPVMHLSRRDRRLVVETLVSPDLYRRVSRGDDIEIVLEDGRTMGATLNASADFSLIGVSSASDLTSITLQPARQLSEADVGDPVTVRIQRKLPGYQGMRRAADFLAQLF